MTGFETIWELHTLTVMNSWLNFLSYHTNLKYHCTLKCGARAVPDTDSHVTCSTNTGFHVTCSIDTDSHMTCSKYVIL